MTSADKLDSLKTFIFFTRYSYLACLNIIEQKFCSMDKLLLGVKTIFLEERLVRIVTMII